MPAPLFTTAQRRAIREEYAEYRGAAGPLSKFAWTHQKARELGCSFETVKDIIKSIPGIRDCRNWTFMDVQQLRQLVGQGMKDSAIARRMGRSRKGVVRKRLRLGLRTKRDASTVLDRIARLTRLGYYDKEISEDVGFCVRSIQNLRKKHKLVAGKLNQGSNIDDRGGGYLSKVKIGRHTSPQETKT